MLRCSIMHAVTSLYADPINSYHRTLLLQRPYNSKICFASWKHQGGREVVNVCRTKRFVLRRPKTRQFDLMDKYLNQTVFCFNKEDRKRIRDLEVLLKAKRWAPAYKPTLYASGQRIAQHRPISNGGLPAESVGLTLIAHFMPCMTLKIQHSSFRLQIAQYWITIYAKTQWNDYSVFHR